MSPHSRRIAPVAPVLDAAPSGGQLFDNGVLVADWHFPSHPLITVTDGASAVAEVDYSLASGGGHWQLRWTMPALEQRYGAIAMTALLGQSPESIDGDSALVAQALDAALQAVGSQMTHTPDPLDPRDASD